MENMPENWTGRVETERPVEQSLILSGSRDRQNLKRRLSVFTESTETAIRKTGQLHQARFDRLKVFKTLFRTVGDACGFCVGMNIPNATSHTMSDCPETTPEQDELFQVFKRAIWYDRKAQGSKPCFKCHICSMGEDALHAKFTTGKASCTNLNLVLPLAFAIHQKPTLRSRAQLYFKTQDKWATIQDYAKWFTTPHPEWAWQSMAILKWYSEYMTQ